jgi:hypothetical protein
MEYNRETGTALMNKHLVGDRFSQKIGHSIAVGELCYLTTVAIIIAHPQMDWLDPDFCGFLGTVHDIGYSIVAEKHEAKTVELLKAEGIPCGIAAYAMHGQLYEQFGDQETNPARYLPQGIEGRILVFSDMCVGRKGIMTVQERADELISALSTSSSKREQEVAQYLKLALPRFQRYEKQILDMANKKSAQEIMSQESELLNAYALQNASH